MSPTPERLPAGWPETWADALSDASLKEASSATIFRRGQTYAASGAVEVTEEDPLPEPALHAQVMGSEMYATEVWIEGDAIAGSCDCPNAEDGWFCKHQVAVAIVWRERLAGTSPSLDEVVQKKVQAGAKRVHTAKDKPQALHDFLHGAERAALADKLLDLAERDHDVSRELHQWRKLSEIKDDAAQLKPMVTDLLSPGRGFIAWNESYAYVRRAEAVLPLLQQARTRDAGVAVALGLHALRKAWGVLAQADDSDGNIGGLCESIGAEMVHALQAAGPQLASFGDTYLQLQLDDPFGCFDAALAEAGMGTAALARYRQALVERWRAAKDAVRVLRAEKAAQSARKGRAARIDTTDETDLRLWTLERLHLAQLEQTGEVDAALAVLREDLSTSHAYSQVVGFLEAHGRLREAFGEAERACKAFPGDWTLEADLLRCYERDGWTQEALVLRHTQFERSPSIERYHLVLKAGTAAGKDSKALRQALLDHLQVQEDEALRKARQPSARPTWRGGMPIPGASTFSDVSLRAEILCSEDQWMEAYALVQPPAVCRDAVLERIALHLPDEHHDQAVQMLQRVFGLVIQRSGSPYREALALVKEIGKRMGGPQRADWLQQLRVQYKAKRNFVRDLPDR